MNIITDTMYFGAVLTILCYSFAIYLRSKIDNELLNPIFIGMTLIIVVLMVVDVSYEEYYSSGKYISYFLTPATICLAVPLYRQSKALKENLFAICVSITAGVFANCITILAVAKILNLQYEYYVTLLPKSITMAVGLPLSTQLGGVSGITVAAIAITGTYGSIAAVWILNKFKITNPIAKGLAIGASCHAIGTTKAIEIGEVEGAMSGLAIGITGLITVVIIPMFLNLL